MGRVGGVGRVGRGDDAREKRTAKINGRTGGQAGTLVEQVICYGDKTNGLMVEN